MRKITTLAVVVAAAVATPAFAQNEDATFDGPYVGAYAGYDKVTIKEEAPNGGSGSKDGVAFGGIFGYNVDMGNTLVGIEAEIGDASTKESEQDFIVTGDEVSLSANLDLFIGARIGFKPSPKSLVYLKAGYAVTKFKAAYFDGTTTYSDTADLDGYRLGAGVEFAVSQSISVRGEYRYSDFGEWVYQGTPTGVGARRHQVVIGVVSKF